MAAFSSGSSLSAYLNAAPIWRDGGWLNLTHVAAIDFDADDGYESAVKFRNTLVQHGAVAYLEPSRRGAHVWVVLGQNLPARTVRRALRGFLAAALVPEGEKVEIRPAHDEIKPDGYGAPLRMPTMPNPKNGRRYPLLDPDDKPLPGRLDHMMLAIEWADADVFVQMAAKTPPRMTDIRPQDKLPTATGPVESASAVLMSVWEVPRAAPGRTIKCPAHTDTIPSLSILRDDERVICKAPHCVLHNDGRGRGPGELRKLRAPTTEGVPPG
jgi:hypothetical protein